MAAIELSVKDGPAARSHVERRGARSDTKAELIRIGLESVLEVGWAATSVEKVLTSIGVPKGSFYHYFRSKDDFGFALIDAYQLFFMRRLERCFGTRPHRSTPALTHRLAAFLSESTVGMRRFHWRRGCLIGALGQELGGLHDGFRKRLDLCMGEWEECLARSIRLAQAAGEIRADADALRLARSFWSSWEGAVLRARLARSVSPLVHMIEDFDRLVHL